MKGNTPLTFTFKDVNLTRNCFDPRHLKSRLKKVHGIHYNKIEDDRFLS